MKKIIIGMLLIVGYLNAGKIFLDYTYNMELNKINNLEKIENTEEFPKPLEIYKDDNNYFFIFHENKLKTINLKMDNYNLKDQIENILKDGYRLKKIIFANKDGKKEILNVGELLKEVEQERKRSMIFNSALRAVLTFENPDKATIILDLREYIKREHKKCINCEELEGMDVTSKSYLNIYFTEKKG